jgi:glutaredoxin-related protein
MKYVIAILAAFVAMISVSYAQEYILFYGNGCPHCAKVEQYFKDNKITKKFDIVQKEVFYNATNLKELNGYLAKHDLTYDKIGVPFLIITSGQDCNYINGDQNIIDYFSGQLAQKASAKCADTTFSGNYLSNNLSWQKRL